MSGGSLSRTPAPASRRCSAHRLQHRELPRRGRSSALGMKDRRGSTGRSRRVSAGGGDAVQHRPRPTRSPPPNTPLRYEKPAGADAGAADAPPAAVHRGKLLERRSRRPATPRAQGRHADAPSVGVDGNGPAGRAAPRPRRGSSVARLARTARGARRARQSYFSDGIAGQVLRQARVERAAIAGRRRRRRPPPSPTSPRGEQPAGAATIRRWADDGGGGAARWLGRDAADPMQSIGELTRTVPAHRRSLLFE